MCGKIDWSINEALPGQPMKIKAILVPDFPPFVLWGYPSIVGAKARCRSLAGTGVAAQWLVAALLTAC